MKFNKNNKGLKYVTDIKERYTIGDINVKIGRTTIKMIDAFLGHIEKYKRLYGLIIKYVACLMVLGLLPELFRWIQQVDWVTTTEYIKHSLVYEIDKVGYVLMKMLQKIALVLMCFIATKEVIEVNYKNKSKSH